MKKTTSLFWTLQSSFSFLLLTFSSVEAQVIPDQTLPVNSIVTSQNGLIIIDGGTIKAGNLFHSFEKFSPGNSTVFFKNTGSIQNIYTRVTGTSISQIDGILKTNGTANLYLLNPKGIVFGQNSRLEVGGSFFASTANAIKFIDGSEFNATNPRLSPLLTISNPVGLEFSGNSGAIIVQGNSQGLVSPSTRTSPISRNPNVNGLRVPSGKNLALVGGDINLEGATLTAEQGRIEVGSVNFGFVSFNPLSQSLPLIYEGVASFKDVRLSQQALVDTSGVIGGSIAIHGKNISVSEGSIVLNQNLGSHPWGSIQIRATETLKLNGNSPDGRFDSLIRTESIGSGNGGLIDVSARELDFQLGGAISNRNYNVADGGNLFINADSIKLFADSPFNPLAVSGIITSTLSSGKAGDINVATRQLEGIDGGQITSISSGTGNAGNIVVNAADFIRLTNSVEIINSQTRANSVISSVAFNQGNAGNLTINTSKLVLDEQGTINTSSTGTGLAGLLTINAPEITIKGGTVSSSIVTANTATQSQFQAPLFPSGEAGGVKINSKFLRLIRGLIAVRNQGSGTAGTLTVDSNFISLDDNSTLTASTTFGEGGNISVNAQSLQLRRNSSITATAANQGNGGNININTRILIGLNNSSIAANAFEGRGGNIRINTQGLFFSPNSVITASSERGINGTVDTNTSRTQADPSNIKAELPSQNPEITSVCQGRTGRSASELENGFVITGTGGLPPSPLDSVNIDPSWRGNPLTTPTTNNFEQPKLSTTQIVPAQGWQFNPDGTVTLIAPSNTINAQYLSQNQRVKREG